MYNLIQKDHAWKRKKDTEFFVSSFSLKDYSVHAQTVESIIDYCSKGIRLQ